MKKGFLQEKVAEGWPRTGVCREWWLQPRFSRAAFETFQKTFCTKRGELTTQFGHRLKCSDDEKGSSCGLVGAIEHKTPVSSPQMYAPAPR